ncbi:hypothetical protein AB0A05_34710 [Streptomyces sp. NPDC046374]
MPHAASARRPAPNYQVKASEPGGRTRCTLIDDLEALKAIGSHPSA